MDAINLANYCYNTIVANKPTPKQPIRLEQAVTANTRLFVCNMQCQTVSERSGCAI